MPPGLDQNQIIISNADVMNVNNVRKVFEVTPT